MSRSAFLDTVDITEPDLATIGPNAVLLRGAKLWCHTFRDWKVSLGRVVVGEDAVVGEGSMLAMNSEVGKHGMLGAGSFLMSNQVVPDDTVFIGNPADVLDAGIRPLVLASFETADHLVEMNATYFEEGESVVATHHPEDPDDSDPDDSTEGDDKYVNFC